MRWGLIPKNSNSPTMGARFINARAETVAEKPLYRYAFESRRCLVPALGYGELKSHPVATRVNSPLADDEELIEPESISVAMGAGYCFLLSLSRSTGKPS